MKIQRGERNISFRTEQMLWTTLVVRIRRGISTFHFQLIPPLVKMYQWLPVLHIFVNTNLRIKYFKTRNGAPMMVSPVTIVSKHCTLCLSSSNGLRWGVSSHSPCFSPSRSSYLSPSVQLHLPYLDLSLWVRLSRPTFLCS